MSREVRRPRTCVGRASGSACVPLQPEYCQSAPLCRVWPIRAAPASAPRSCTDPTRPARDCRCPGHLDGLPRSRRRGTIGRVSWTSIREMSREVRRPRTCVGRASGSACVPLQPEYCQSAPLCRVWPIRAAPASAPRSCTDPTRPARDCRCPGHLDGLPRSRHDGASDDKTNTASEALGRVKPDTRRQAPASITLVAPPGHLSVEPEVRHQLQAETERSDGRRRNDEFRSHESGCGASRVDRLSFRQRQ